MAHAPDAAADRYVLFGHPVRHSWSPYIHRRFAEQSGRALDYSLSDVAPAQFAAAVREFFAGGGAGANVTVPHKQAAAALVDELTPRAARAGAVNTLVRSAIGLLGDNTDGAGLLADLTEHVGFDIRARRVLLLGAGGATRGVLGPLLDAGPAEVRLANRTAERARELARLFAADGNVVGGGPDDIPVGAYDLVVNATSAGLAGEVADVPGACFGPQTVAYDMAYARPSTPFAAFAAAHGATRIHLGWGMLVEQAAEAYRLWRGVRPVTRDVLSRLAAGANPSD